MYEIYEAINRKTNENYAAEVERKTKIPRDEILFYAGVLEKLKYIDIVVNPGKPKNPLFIRK